MILSKMIGFNWTDACGKVYHLKLVHELAFLYDRNDPEYQARGASDSRLSEEIYHLQAPMTDGSYDMAMADEWRIPTDDIGEVFDLARKMVDDQPLVQAWIRRVGTIVPGSDEHQANTFNHPSEDREARLLAELAEFEDHKRDLLN